MTEKENQQVFKAIKEKLTIEELSFSNVFPILISLGKYGKDKRRAANEWFRRNKKHIESLVKNSGEENGGVEIKVKELMEYNKNSDEYVFYPTENSNLVGSFVLPGYKVRAIVSAYSNFFGRAETVTKISIQFSIPRTAVIHMLRALGVTHDSIPYTNEEVMDKSEQFFLEDSAEKRKFAISQKISRANWEQTKREAEQWTLFKENQLNVIHEVLKNLKPKEITRASFKKSSKNPGNTVFVATLSDDHWGDVYHNKSTGLKFNIEIAEQYLDSYIKQICEEEGKYSHCEILLVGDHMNSCVDGKTRKLTPLRNELINEKLFEKSLDLMVKFIEVLAEKFGKVKVRATAGNHGGFIETILYMAVQKYFSKDKRIEINIYEDFISAFEIGGAMFLLSHGGAAEMKISVPNRSGDKMDAYIQTFILDHKELCLNTKGRYFIQGHLHSYRHEMRNCYDYILVSAGVPATEHSNNLGFRNSPMHQCFLVKDGYIETVKHYRL